VRSNECGESLLEVVIAVGIVAIVAGALGGSTIVAAHRFGPDAVQSALEAYVAREMRVAVDVMKYQGADLSPRTIATAIPMPSASPLAAHVALNSSTSADGSVTIVLTATSDADSSKSATLRETIAAPAPIPGARIPAQADGPAPQ
jgi:Tfp pilus assembly protein PilV